MHASGPRRARTRAARIVPLTSRLFATAVRKAPSPRVVGSAARTWPTADGFASARARIVARTWIPASRLAISVVTPPGASSFTAARAASAYTAGIRRAERAQHLGLGAGLAELADRPERRGPARRVGAERRLAELLDGRVPFRRCEPHERLRPEPRGRRARAVLAPIEGPVDARPVDRRRERARGREDVALELVVVPGREPPEQERALARPREAQRGPGGDAADGLRRHGIQGRGEVFQAEEAIAHQREQPLGARLVAALHGAVEHAAELAPEQRRGGGRDLERDPALAERLRERGRVGAPDAEERDAGDRRRAADQRRERDRRRPRGAEDREGDAGGERSERRGGRFGEELDPRAHALRGRREQEVRDRSRDGHAQHGLGELDAGRRRDPRHGRERGEREERRWPRLEGGADAEALEHPPGDEELQAQHHGLGDEVERAEDGGHLVAAVARFERSLEAEVDEVRRRRREQGVDREDADDLRGIRGRARPRQSSQSMRCHGPAWPGDPGKAEGGPAARDPGSSTIARVARIEGSGEAATQRAAERKRSAKGPPTSASPRAAAPTAIAPTVAAAAQRGRRRLACRAWKQSIAAFIATSGRRVGRSWSRTQRA